MFYRFWLIPKSHSYVHFLCISISLPAKVKMTSAVVYMLARDISFDDDENDANQVKKIQNSSKIKVPRFSDR